MSALDRHLRLDRQSVANVEDKRGLEGGSRRRRRGWRRRRAWWSKQLRRETMVIPGLGIPVKLQVVLLSRSDILLTAGRRNHWTSGRGTPVTLHMRTTVSPSWTVVSSLDSSSIMAAGTIRHGCHQYNYKVHSFKRAEISQAIICNVAQI